MASVNRIRASVAAYFVDRFERAVDAGNDNRAAGALRVLRGEPTLLRTLVLEQTGDEEYESLADSFMMNAGETLYRRAG